MRLSLNLGLNLSSECQDFVPNNLEEAIFDLRPYSKSSIEKQLLVVFRLG